MLFSDYGKKVSKSCHSVAHLGLSETNWVSDAKKPQPLFPVPVA
jgi:hypothetical protein